MNTEHSSSIQENSVGWAKLNHKQKCPECGSRRYHGLRLFGQLLKPLRFFCKDCFHITYEHSPAPTH